METYSNNLLQNNGFAFVLERIPQTIFRVVSCDIPSMNVPPAPAGFPGASQNFPGTFTEFDDLTLEFLVDEDLKNYEEIYHWMMQQRFAIGDEYTPKNDMEIPLVSDGALTTMTNASNANRVFKFVSMFPVFLGSIHFDTSINQPDPITCTVTFKYSYFKMMPKEI